MTTKLLRYALVLGLCGSLLTSTVRALEQPTNEELQLLRVSSKAFAYVAQQASPAVVSIRVATSYDSGAEFGIPFRGQDESADPFSEEFFRRFFGQPSPNSGAVIGQGSGCLVSSDGYILTNNHIVGRADRIEVALPDGRQFKAEIVGTDPPSDLAVIKIEGKDLPYLKLGDSDDLAIGEWVVAIGAPFGLEATVTVGVVSGKQRTQLGITDSDDFIQTDAAINPGNSGGPLLNLSAEVVGINTAIVTRSGASAGVGFAIPSNMAKRIMEQLISSGRVTRGFLGLALQNVDRDLATALGSTAVKGALVTEVFPDSPAKTAGIETGDIITEVNGKGVESITALRNAVSLMEPGEKATLTVHRNGKILHLGVVVGAHPHSSGGVVQQLGLELAPLTDATRTKHGFGREERGVLVTAVTPNSPAARARLTEGTLIVGVGRNPVATPQEVSAAVEALAQRKEPIPLLVRQGIHTRYVILKPSSER
jgi:serine protease Do